MLDKEILVFAVAGGKIFGDAVKSAPGNAKRKRKSKHGDVSTESECHLVQPSEKASPLFTIGEHTQYRRLVYHRCLDCLRLGLGQIERDHCAAAVAEHER